MRRITEELVASFKNEPDRWKQGRYRVFRDDGIDFWTANGLSFFAPENCKLPASFSYWQRRRLWRAYKEWLNNLSLEAA